jgi:hypothetical protein
MSWRELGTKFDDRVGRGTDRIARRTSRRDVLRTAVLGSVAAAGAIALGQRPALAAVHCKAPCGSGGGSPRCSGCPSLGCPSGMKLCKNNCHGLCPYPHGTWVRCTGLGRCGKGYTVCQDCHSEGSCNVCECESGIQCADCCSSADVQAERRRMNAVLATSA